MRIARTAMSQLNRAATRYAAEMIAEHGVEGAKKIAADIEARRCPDCGLCPF